MKKNDYFIKKNTIIFLDKILKVTNNMKYFQVYSKKLDES